MMVDRKLLRLSATLLVIGGLVPGLAMSLHACAFGSACDTEQATFMEYARSSSWATIHQVQFVGTAIAIAGLIVLFFALGVSEGTPRWLGLFGAITAGVALALAGVVYAVDGVALKQVVDAWVSAPAAEQAARFASAEAIRSLEWGARSYEDFTFGLALVLFAATIVWTARITRWIGYAMGLLGLIWILTGWSLGNAPLSTSPSTLGVLVVPTYYFLFPAWSIWLLVVAWRMREPVPAAQKSGATS